MQQNKLKFTNLNHIQLLMTGYESAANPLKKGTEKGNTECVLSLLRMKLGIFETRISFCNY